MKHYFSSLLILVSLSFYSQSKSFVIEWEDNKVLKTSVSTTEVPSFNARYYFYDPQTRLITYLNQWDINGYIDGSTAKLTNANYSIVNATSLPNIDLDNLPSSPNLTLTTANARDKRFAVIELAPIIKDNGVYKRLESFTVSYSENTASRSTVQNTKQPIQSSILANGTFFRFYVEKDGVFRLSRNFLSDLGMDVNSIDPRRLKIYGHQGRSLPLQNSLNKNYDPPQLAIQVIGEGDGSFDNDDSILFYGDSTLGFVEENNSNINPYADRAYYYITADGEPGKRISSLVEPSGTADTTISTFDDYQFIEEDRFSPAIIGRRWFGDRFDVESDRSYEFIFPNIVASEEMLVKVYAASSSQSATSLLVSVNGLEVDNLQFRAIQGTSLGFADEYIGNVTPTSSTVTVDLSYNNGGNPASRGFLDYISIEAKRQLIADNEQFHFKNNDVVNQTGIGEYTIQNAQNISQVWDITDQENIRSVSNVDAQATLNFKTSLGELRRFIAISPADFFEPKREADARVANQDLKGNIFTDSQGNFADVDYLMIVDNTLFSEANRLAQFRSQLNNINIKVVQLQTIYNEFSSGRQDLSAIRNFVKYVYDNATSPQNRLQYVCLFGDSSIDYKDRLEGNNLIVPTYERLSSFSLLTSFASDDFFGMMDPEDGTFRSSDKLEIAMGRIVADTPQLARDVVNKIIDYDTRESYGRWRNNFLLISDDVDVPFEHQAIQVQLDALGDEIGNNKPNLNVYKIHSDAFQQQSTAGGQRYPEVNRAIADALERGAIVTNYFGHGGEDGLANEFIVTQPNVNDYANNNRFTTFLTVTCEFTKFDNPLRISAGELTIWNPIGASVAMVTTTREITVSGGVSFNNVFAPFLFDYDNIGDSVAESLRKAKNELNGTGKLVVFYLGDPAMRLADPEPEIKLTHINDKPLGQANDTLKALSKVKMRGQVVSPQGTPIPSFNGNLEVTIFDKRIERETLGNDNTRGNDGELLILNFTTLGNTIFRGQATVTNGEFEYEFVVPRDIGVPVGNGRISFYAEQEGELKDKSGFNQDIVVGGINENAPEDNIGPEINLFMNDESFVSGGITGDSPFILAKLQDENGINTASGIGHDITAVLDGEEVDPIILNDFYETEVDDFQNGTVLYRLRDLEEGLHTLTFTAWDTYNNRSTQDIQFIVRGDGELEISNVLNYPNPFTDYTEFWFRHNRIFEPLEVQVQVFTVSGKVVWSQNQVVNTGMSNLSRSITWDGRDDFGDRIGKGTYIYKLTVKSTTTNKTFEKFEKLVIL